MAFTPEYITVHGDLVDDDGEPLPQEMEMWVRDPVECVRELLRNPAFKDVTDYRPRKIYQDRAKKERYFGEMSSGKWW